jgi:small conductance mechanosensitive channel
MNFNLDLIWRTVQGLINGFLASLPTLLIALVVFGIVLLIARGVGAVIHRIAHRRSGHSNVALVLA